MEFKVGDRVRGIRTRIREGDDYEGTVRSINDVDDLMGIERDDGEPGWLGKLISGINSKEVRFDSYAASGPQGIVNTERRQPSNLFA